MYTDLGTDFGGMLRQHRTARRFTQEGLAGDAEISTRHLSFLEGGRARPSREMVLVLASALELPLRDRNALLVAAGFAPVYRDSPLGDTALVPVMRAVDHILAQQEPYGAVVVDRTWNVIKANHGAMRLFSLFPPTDPAAMQNLLIALCDPGGVRRHVVNWAPLVSMLVERQRREVAAFPADRARRDLLERVLAYPDIAAIGGQRALLTSSAPFGVMHLRHGEVEAKLFTLLTSLGTPLDVTAEELVIESYFPADEATERLLRST